VARTNKDAPAAPAGELRGFIEALVRHNPRSLGWVALVQLVSTAVQGLGLLLLVPLLDVAGVGGRHSATGGLANLARSALSAVGVSLTLGSLLVAYVILVAVAALLSAYSTVRLLRYRLEFVDGLRERVFGAVADAEWKHLVALRQSDVLSTMTLNVSWVSLGAQAVLGICITAVLVVVQLVVAVRISPVVTALAAVTGAALIATVWPLVSRSRRLGRELVDNNRGVLAAMTGFLDGLKLAKAHALEAGHLSAFHQAIRRSRRSQIAFSAAQQTATAVQLTVTAVVLAVLIDLAVTRFHVALAGLLVVAFIFSRLVPQITSAQQNLQQIAQSLPAFGDLVAIIEGCEQQRETPVVARHTLGAGRNRLELRRGITLQDVSFCYHDNGPSVLHDVSLDIPSQHTTALVGPSGAGKTTLADIVVGLLEPASGQVLVDGRQREGSDRRAWRTGIALVPQEPFLFHETVRANLLWARPGAKEEELWEALVTAAAADFVYELPQELDTVVGDRGTRLSGGERQRIALARGLLRQPDLLILDEATSSLDSENERAIRTALAQLHGRITMLVIAHRLSTVSNADAVVVLDAGRVVEAGAWSDLAARDNGRLRALIDAGSIG
jgi:ATP-binding cassette subfamily C protein